MKVLAIRASRPAHKLARVIVALIAAAVLLGSALRDASASITLIKFEAAWQDNGTIRVVWETSSENGSVAYFLYRAKAESGPWEDYYDFEAATGYEDHGATYAFVDDEVTEGVTYWYRLEELDYDGNSSFHGPIMAVEGAISATSTSTSGTRSATSTPTSGTNLLTSTPTATQRPRQDSTPGAGGTVSVMASPRPGSPLVTTPTPIGGIPPAPPATLSPEVTATSEDQQIQQTDTPTVTTAPTLQPSQQSPTPLPSPQPIAAAPKETSQPLLDAAAAQTPPAPPAETRRNNTASSRLALLLGASALAAAAILGAVVLLIWRRRSR
jgi:hypothetical protein